VRFTLDANVLVYAIDVEAPEKRVIAFDLVVRALTADVVLTIQALAEFLAVVGRKSPAHFDTALAQADEWARIMPLAHTEWSHVSAAAAFAGRYRLQFWDSLIWQVAKSAGAEVFVSEDLQDGLSIDGMTVIDPFNPANADRLARLFEGGSPRP
jgi:predicted nucleic acid-binding protein